MNYEPTIETVHERMAGATDKRKPLFGYDEMAVVLARLATAEQERDQLREFLSIADSRAGTEHTNRVLAEARVEALSEALRRLHQRFGHREFCDCATCIDVRAALACPPQQRGE